MLKRFFLLCCAASTLLNAVDTKLTSIAFDICLLNNINILSSRVSVVHKEEVERLEEKAVKWSGDKIGKWWESAGKEENLWTHLMRALSSFFLLLLLHLAILSRSSNVFARIYFLKLILATFLNNLKFIKIIFWMKTFYLC